MTSASALANAEAALLRGEYAQCLSLLDELANKNPLTTNLGASIRIKMVTALIGQGDEKKAIEICKSLSKSQDPEIRQEAKQLLGILEAPSLPRPKSWSIQIPKINNSELKGYTFSRAKKKNLDRENKPPTGPTKAFNLGFSIFLGVILFLLTVLLSGCVQVINNIDLSGPDRIRMGWEIKSSSGYLLPWQIQLERSIEKSLPQLSINLDEGGKQIIKSEAINSKEANFLLQEITQIASDSAGLDPNESQIQLKERNWLLAVQQELHLFIDLRDLPEIPGFSMSVSINPGLGKNNVSSEQAKIISSKKEMLWVLQEGVMNELKILKWNWNPLGVGALFILMFLSLSVILQSIRVKMGLGFPELPP